MTLPTVVEPAWMVDPARPNEPPSITDQLNNEEFAQLANHKMQESAVANSDKTTKHKNSAVNSANEDFQNLSKFLQSTYDYPGKIKHSKENLYLYV